MDFKNDKQFFLAEIQVNGYTFLRCNEWVKKIDILTTHSSAVMHGSKNSNFWLHIPPL